MLAPVSTVFGCGIQLTLCPSIDWVTCCIGRILVRIFPVEFHLIVRIDEHDISNGSWSPRVATDPSMAIQVPKTSLVCPNLVSLAPSKLLESMIV